MKFVSFTFNNDPSGKLLLGITFALSKEYSDKLSLNVERGNRLSMKEGKYVNKAKSGCYKDNEARLRPDGENFFLLKEAFRKRLSGHTLEEIAEYINSKKEFAREGSISKRSLPRFTKQMCSVFLSDPIYAGVIIYGKGVYNLFDIYDFAPMITPYEYMIMNKDSKDSRVKKIYGMIKKNGVKADLLRGIVFCSYCGNPRTSAITTKKIGKAEQGKVINYYNYRCDTVGCKMKGKSTRAKVIIDYVAQYVAQNFKFSEGLGSTTRKKP